MDYYNLWALGHYANMVLLLVTKCTTKREGLNTKISMNANFTDLCIYFPTTLTKPHTYHQHVVEEKDLALVLPSASFTLVWVDDLKQTTVADQATMWDRQRLQSINKNMSWLSSSVNINHKLTQWCCHNNGGTRDLSQQQ